MTVSAPPAVRHVIEKYKRFLRTSFGFLDPHLRQQFEEHPEGMDVLARGRTSPWRGSSSGGSGCGSSSAKACSIPASFRPTGRSARSVCTGTRS